MEQIKRNLEIRFIRSIRVQIAPLLATPLADAAAGTPVRAASAIMPMILFAFGIRLTVDGRFAEAIYNGKREKKEMKKAIILAALTMIVSAGSAFADVKIKSKQTMSGQSTESTTYIKGKRQRTESMNGTLITITQCDLRRDVQLNETAKTYLVNAYDNSTAVAQGQPTTTQVKSVETTKGGTMYITTTIKDTGERKQMFGYTARHIIQTVEMESSPDSCNPTKNKMEMDMWVIDAEFGLACTQERQYRPVPNGKNGGCQDKIVPKTIGTGKSGYPLYQKMTSFDASGKESFTMIQEVIEMSKATLDQALFEVPGEYREVKDSSQLYASGVSSGVSFSGGNSSNLVTSANPPSSGMASGLKSSQSNANSDPAPVGPKKEGTVRVGVAAKTTAVGEGITAADLTVAIQNALGQHLKGTKVEIVPLEAKLVSAQATEARDKECDFILQATAAHKKGGGGFGGFGKMLGSVAPIMGGGSMVGHVAASAIITAAGLSGNMKAKDELTLDLKMQSTADNSVALAKLLKVKAKSDGEDIISSIIEQAAQAILDTVGK